MLYLHFTIPTSNWFFWEEFSQAAIIGNVANTNEIQYEVKEFVNWCDVIKLSQSKCQEDHGNVCRFQER